MTFIETEVILQPHPEVVTQFIGVDETELTEVGLIPYRLLDPKHVVLVDTTNMNGYVGLKMSLYEKVIPDKASIYLIPSTEKVVLEVQFIDMMVAQANTIVLTGGEHVGIDITGKHTEPKIGHSHNPTRDRLDLLIYQSAKKHNKPILGICRGLQVVAAGEGVVIADMPASHHPLVGDQPQNHLIYPVGERLAPLQNFNSAHFKGILLKDATELEKAGWSVDFVGPDANGQMSENSPIEICVGERGRGLLFQGHPERMTGKGAEWVRDWIKSHFEKE